MVREPTGEFDVARDIAWEVPLPPHLERPRASASSSRPGMPSGPVLDAPAKLAPARRAPEVLPSPLTAEETARLRRLLDFVQWERVAMVRFGLAEPEFAKLPFDPFVGVGRRLPGSRPLDDLLTLRRAYERLHALAAQNRRAIDELLARLGQSLGIQPDDVQ